MGWKRRKDKRQGESLKTYFPISSLTFEFPGILQLVEKDILNKILVKSPRKQEELAHFLSVK